MKKADYKGLLQTIEELLTQFEQIKEKIPEIFWWSIVVPENIITNNAIDVTLYRWGELLQNDYKEDLCNLGGIGEKNGNEWTLFAVTGADVTFADFVKVADACASAAKALGICEQPTERFKVCEYYDGFIKKPAPGIYKKYPNMLKDAYKSLWLTDAPKVRLGVSEYLDGFAQGKYPGNGQNVNIQKGYWILKWFDFIFDTAQENGCPVRVNSRTQYATGWDNGPIPFRHTENNICEASILALKFLQQKSDLASKKQKNVRNKKQGKYPVDFLNRVQVRFNKLRNDGMDAKGAWNEAAEAFAIKSGKAAEMACRRCHLYGQNK